MRAASPNGTYQQQLINSSSTDTDLQPQSRLDTISLIRPLMRPNTHISCPSRERSFSITSQNSNPRVASGHTGRRGCETGALLDDPATARLDSGVQVTKKYSLLGSASVSITQSTGNAPWHANLHGSRLRAGLLSPCRLFCLSSRPNSNYT